MDWLVDRRDPGSMHRAVAQLESHLRRHAAADPGVDAVAPVRDALAGRSSGSEGLLWLSLDWRAARPRVVVAELADGAAFSSDVPQVGSALLPGTMAAVVPESTRLIAEISLDLERRAREAFAEGPPPIDLVDADPHRDGAASVAVALSAAGRAHPYANPAQAAALAGAVLGAKVASESAPVSGGDVAAMLVEAHRALGSEAEVLSADDENVEVVISRCPFGPGVADNEALCHVSTGLAGHLGARVNGEATVVLPESIAAGDRACYLQVRLGAVAEDVRGEVHRWPPVAGAASRDAPHLMLSVNLPSETGSVPVVRRLAAQALRSFGVAEPDVGDVQVAIGEACANVIRHAIDSDTYEVQVEVAADHCAITVIDQGGGFDATAVPQAPDPRSEGGRGLALMRALTDKVAFHNQPQAGTVVHMTKRLAHDATHPLWNRPPVVGST